MKVITWNIRRATKSSDAWKIISDLNPDIALLQEVNTIPDDINKAFSVKFKKAINKNGKEQKFGTAILVKGKIVADLKLSSKYDWVNKELDYFDGNLISCTAKLDNDLKFNIISVYSPAWPVNPDRIKNIDVSAVKLKKDAKVWMTEVLWSALKNIKLNKSNWVIGGDLNSSETFDSTWATGGNKEILDRMDDLGFTECLRGYNGKLVPTFRNPREGVIIHQLDHLFVTNKLFSTLKKCEVGNKFDIFKKSISDHLPIIANFK